MINNINRPERAYEAIVRYADLGNSENEPLDCNVADLLADLMHLCDRDGQDFEDCLRRGRMHYTDELSSESLKQNA